MARFAALWMSWLFMLGFIGRSSFFGGAFFLLAEKVNDLFSMGDPCKL